MQAERDSRGIRQPILNFGSNGVNGQCQSTGKDARTDCTEDWMGHRAGLDRPSGFKSRSPDRSESLY